MSSTSKGLYRHAETDLADNATLSDLLNRIAASLDAPWTTYTPTFAGITLGNGSAVARYKQVGSLMHWQGVITLGSTSVVTSTILITPPVQGGGVNGAQCLGSTCCIHAGTPYPGTTTWWSGTQLAIIAAGSGGAALASRPFVWASGDSLSWDIRYEAVA